MQSTAVKPRTGFIVTGAASRPQRPEKTTRKITLGFVSDLHFGPEARFEGKLRKLTAHAGSLASAAVAAVDRVGVDALVNLGDDIEDESHDLDLARYLECQAALRPRRPRRRGW